MEDPFQSPTRSHPFGMSPELAMSFIVLLFPSERSLSDKMYSLSDEKCTLSMKTGWME